MHTTLVVTGNRVDWAAANKQEALNCVARTLAFDSQGPVGSFEFTLVEVDVNPGKEPDIHSVKYEGLVDWDNDENDEIVNLDVLVRPAHEDHWTSLPIAS